MELLSEAKAEVVVEEKEMDDNLDVSHLLFCFVFLVIQNLRLHSNDVSK